MDYIVKIDWPRMEVTSLSFPIRADALEHLADIEDTLGRINACVSSRKQGDHTVGLLIGDDSADTVIQYVLVGV